LSIGINIRKLREKNFLSQEELANKLGMTQQAIDAWERSISNPRKSTIDKLSAIFSVPSSTLFGEKPLSAPIGIKIPVLGRVVAGIPLEATTEILDWEEITPEVASTGEYFALQIKGSSMMPRIQEGDVVIVKKQPSVESGEIAIVLINGDEATIKQVYVQENGIMLQAYNPTVYPAHFYNNEEIQKLPVCIMGKVVELRGKF